MCPASLKSGRLAFAAERTVRGIERAVVLTAIAIADGEHPARIMTLVNSSMVCLAKTSNGAPEAAGVREVLPLGAAVRFRGRVMGTPLSVHRHLPHRAPCRRD